VIRNLRALMQQMPAGASRVLIRRQHFSAWNDGRHL